MRKPALSGRGAVGFDQTLAFIAPNRRHRQPGATRQINDRIFFDNCGIILLTASAFWELPSPYSMYLKSIIMTKIQLKHVNFTVSDPSKTAA